MTAALCTEDGCEFAALFAGRCSIHADDAAAETCAYDNCAAPATTREWCRRHYLRLIRARAIPLVRFVTGNCECGKPAQRRWDGEPVCRAHYQQAWKRQAAAR